MKRTADSIYKNGKVYTMDSSNSVQEAVAIAEGKILFTGSNAEAEAYEGLNTKIIDLGGKTVFPGMIDTHIHAPGSGYIVLYNINLYNACSEEETLSVIRGFIEEHPEKDAYFGRGFNPGYFTGLEGTLGPKKEKLDAICNDKPIVLTDFGGHILWLNTIAFETYGITKETPSPQGGVIEKDPETGELWGTLKEYAKQLVPYQTFTPEENVEAVRWFQNKLHSYGYTSVFALRPPGAIIPRETLFEALSELEKRGELKLRVNGARDMDPSGEIQPQIEELKALKSKYDSNLIQVSTAKYFADGVIEGITGCLLEPYGKAADKGNDFYGEFVWDKEKLKEAFVQTMKAGFQIHVHSIGDGATHYTLDALEKAYAQVPKGDYRNTLTHLQLVAPEDILRMAKLNVIATTQPYWHFKSPSMYEQLEYPLLGERAEREYPLKSFFDAGVKVTASGDHPVTPEPNPFHAIQAAVTRNLYNAEDYGLPPLTDMDDPKWLLNKEERVAVLDMIRAFTINGAYALCKEDEIGSIEAGKYADLMIVDQDPFEISPLELENISVVETIFNGESVYRKK